MKTNRHFICDMDGVIYRGNQLISGVADFIRNVQEAKRDLLFLTNSSEKTPEQYLAKLEMLGITGLKVSQFYTSALATRDYLLQHAQKKTVYVVSEPGLKEVLRQAGFTLTEEAPEAVVVGHTRQLDFTSLTKATQLILAGSRFIGTNPDKTDPVEEGLEPACGSLLAYLEAATGTQPYVVGKPNAFMMQQAIQTIGRPAHELLMIGDRMDTDIKGGLTAGLHTLLVLSGVTPLSEVSQYPYQPDEILPTVGSIEMGGHEG